MGVHYKSFTNYKSTLFVISFVFVSINSANTTTQYESQRLNGTRSKMAWLKIILDHHDWTPEMMNSSEVTQECREHLTQYVNALNDGKLWASKSEYLNFQ